jgi:uncharacterized membrane protein YfcA
MPLLALTLGMQTATPLVALVGVTSTIVIAWSSWQQIDLRAARKLLLGSIVGIPVGLLLLKAAPEGLVKGVLGFSLVGFSLYNLARPRLAALRRESWAYGFGFLAGVLGGAYNTNGPPVVLYGALRRWPPERFRATLQGYFVPAGLLIWIGHALAGLWTRRVLTLYVLALPLLLVTIPLGSRLHRRIPAQRFEQALYVLLIGLGGLLLV